MANEFVVRRGLKILTVQSGSTSQQALVLNQTTNNVESTQLPQLSLSAVTEDILPAFDEVYDIGSPTKKWYDGYFTNKIQIGDTASITSDIDGDLTINTNLIIQGTASADVGDFGTVIISGNTIRNVELSSYSNPCLVIDDCLQVNGNLTVSGGNITLSGSPLILSPYEYGSGLQSIEPISGTNITTGTQSVIGGGCSNTNTGTQSVIGGGCNNTNTGCQSVIGGGVLNTLTGCQSVIGGGFLHTVSGIRATVGGGDSNTAGDGSTVGGGYSNTAGVTYATVGGGALNNASNCYTTIAGGLSNTASACYSVVGAGRCNTASGVFSGILGGRENTASCSCSMIVGTNISTQGPKTTFVNNLAFYAQSSSSTFLGNPEVAGEIVYFGTFQDTTAAGQLIVFTTTGTTGWHLADADTVAESTGLLGIALGTTAGAGILLRGFARSSTYYTTTGVADTLYVSATAGGITDTAPSTTGQVVRVVGYMVDDTNDVIYFCPDNTWVQV